MKVKIILEDKPKGAVEITFDFDPPVSDSIPDTPAGNMAAKILEIMQGMGPISKKEMRKAKGGKSA
jgi:hypothetical protein